MSRPPLYAHLTENLAPLYHAGGGNICRYPRIPYHALHADLAYHA